MRIRFARAKLVRSRFAGGRGNRLGTSYGRRKPTVKLVPAVGAE